MLKFIERYLLLFDFAKYGLCFQNDVLDVARNVESDTAIIYQNALKTKFVRKFLILN